MTAAVNADNAGPPMAGFFFAAIRARTNAFCQSRCQTAVSAKIASAGFHAANLGIPALALALALTLRRLPAMPTVKAPYRASKAASARL